MTHILAFLMNICIQVIWYWLNIWVFESYMEN